MFELFLKIFRTSKTVIPVSSLGVERAEILAIGEKISEKVKKLFRGSLAIREVDTGSDNAPEQELVALSNSYYDIERFGVHFVASPRHADMLMVTGPVTRNMAEALRRAYNSTPNPKIIVAVGDDAIDGGIFRGSYAVEDGVDQVVPVNYNIPGDPPSPIVIMRHLLRILEVEDKKSKKK
ncbi:MAG: hypothetical protein HY225_04150 [Candidatus Vogelbacteria bacterium]|nr:hypothetical protein [Candidatus Vogelbacteria bacterium]